MPKQSSELLPNLAEPSMSNIGDIELKGSNVKDDDLKYSISHISEIHSPALSQRI